MEVKEIAKRQGIIYKSIAGSSSVTLMDASATRFWLAEIALQIAILNEPVPPVNEEAKPKWVWFKYNRFKWVVDAREVASVSAPDENHCVIIMRNEGGDDPGRWCDGNIAEVCAKLGIPVPPEDL